MAKCIEIKPRYIDANKINWQQVEYEYGKRNNTIIACEIAVDETPEVDVAPVVHAHWIEKEDCSVVTDIPWSMCSACGSYSLKLPYCAFCGAKMDEEKEG